MNFSNQKPIDWNQGNNSTDQNEMNLNHVQNGSTQGSLVLKNESAVIDCKLINSLVTNGNSENQGGNSFCNK